MFGGLCGGKFQRPRMAGDERACLRHGADAELAQGGVDFFEQELDHVVGPLRADRRHALEESAAGKRARRPERDRADHVEPGADA